MLVTAALFWKQNRKKSFNISILCEELKRNNHHAPETLAGKLALVIVHLSVYHVTCV